MAGYRLSGPDQFTCKNGTLSPSHASTCSPLLCPRIQSLENGNVHLSPDENPRQDSVYTFTCRSSYWLSGPNRKVCESGKWKPSHVPTCRPMPCNALPCVNGGTCTNTNTNNYLCKCTREWHGKTCNRRTVHKDSLTGEIKKFIQNGGGACKPQELYDYLADENRGRYPSYMWVIYCHTAAGYFTYRQRQVIYIKYGDDFDIFVAWQDQHSPSGIQSRFTKGQTKAKQHLTNLRFNCNTEAMRQTLLDEFKSINLNHMVISVSRGGFSYVGHASMIFDLEKKVSCDKSDLEKAGSALTSVFTFGISRYSSKKQGQIAVVVIGAKL